MASGQGAVDQAAAEAGLGAVVAVEVDLVGVVGQQGELMLSSSVTVRPKRQR